MAKRRNKRVSRSRTGFKWVLISLGITFSAILFILKILTGNVGWLQVFYPVVIAFFIIFLLSVFKAMLKKI
jgi:hypothetical protein